MAFNAAGDLFIATDTAVLLASGATGTPTSISSGYSAMVAPDDHKEPGIWSLTVAGNNKVYFSTVGFHCDSDPCGSVPTRSAMVYELDYSGSSWTRNTIRTVTLSSSSDPVAVVYTDSNDYTSPVYVIPLATRGNDLYVGSWNTTSGAPGRLANANPASATELDSRLFGTALWTDAGEMWTASGSNTGIFDKCA